MAKRIVAILACLALLFAAGCDFFPTDSPSAGAPTAPASASASAPAGSASASVSGSDSAVSAEPTGSPEDTTSDSASPSSTPSAKPTATQDSTEGMVFPNSDTELLMWKDLIVLDSDKLDMARNEIYARAGYKFTTKKYIDYFGALSWYKVDPSFSDKKLSEIQLANIHLIQVAEKAVKGLLFQADSGLKLDYDQDGVLETMTIAYPDDNHATITIKDGTKSTVWKVEGENIIKKVFLGDIKTSDGILDLFVGESGPSDDFLVHIAGIKHLAFLQRGDVPGNVNGGTDKKSPFTFDGKGVITTLERMDTVGTDYFISKYKMDSAGKLVFSPLASYNFISFTGSKYTVKTKVALKLHKSNDSGSAITVNIPMGTTIQFVSTDAKKWVKITAPGGTGWLELEKPLKILDPNIDTFDAFDGLIMAD